MNLNPQQKKLVQTILNVGRQRGANRTQLLAAIDTGITETGLTNPTAPGSGDGTSIGWRQETSSSYPHVDRTDVKGAADRFFKETSQYLKQHGNTAPGALSQGVQRSAYPGRYAQHTKEAAAILRQFGSAGASAASQATAGAQQAATPQAATSPASPKVPTTPQGANIYQVLSNLSKLTAPKDDQAPSNNWDFLAGLVGQTAVQGNPETGGGGQGAIEKNVVDNAGGDPNKATGYLKRILERAAKIDAKHYNYEWTGGHGGTGVPNHGTGHGSGPGIGYDCSGAVSAVLGVNPRVSGEFASWGQPGKGKNVTIYANSTHVFMEINGQFWGTSGANKGGGAGWVPASHFSKGYLSGFTARHPVGL